MENTQPVLFRPGVDLNEPQVHYPGFAPGQTLLKAGTVLKEGAAALVEDLIYDRDVAVQLRDGKILYTDVYRPASATGPLAAIIGWSPYGKRDGFITFDSFPFRAGVPQHLLSGLDKFEGADPNWWCPRGYAIVSPDARGAYRSEGQLHVWDQQEGRDGADVVEWAAAQPWSNGKVGLAGTSWLGISQWFIAAERPPHLAAIAPWEGMDDAYRFCFADGGIPYAGFVDWLLKDAPAAEGIENVAAMLEKYPDFNAYWAGKRAAVERIDVPAYVTVSWGSKLHHKGGMEGWHRLQTEHRWLRLNDGLEWPDFYHNSVQEDLRRFFDYYLRGLANDWPATPRVRMTVCDFAHHDVVDRPEQEFPLTRTTAYPFYLDGAGQTLGLQPGAAATAAYDAASGETTFDVTFAQPNELTGYVKAHLWVEADGADDADLFVKLEKLDAAGKVLGRILIPKDEPEYESAWPEVVELAEGFGRAGFLYDGPWGRMRASCRHLTTDPREQPVYGPERRLAPGEVVELVITFSATALLIQPCETVRLVVSGTNLTPFAFPGAAPLQLRNHGRHVLHTGEKYPARLVLPLMLAPSLVAGPRLHAAVAAPAPAAPKPVATSAPLEASLAPAAPAEHPLAGKWAVTINTPIGKQHPEITFILTQGAWQGTSRNPDDNEETPLTDLQVEGSEVQWSQVVTKPIRAHSTFRMALTGTTMAGTVKAGFMPSAKVTAEKQ